MAKLDFPANTSQSPYSANGVTYVWDGQKWTATVDSTGGSLSVHVGTNPPSGDSTEGDLWWQDEEARLYVYYTDDDSSQWVDASPGGGSNGGGGGSGIAGITIQDEGVSSNQDATTLNFVGAGVDVTGDGNTTKTITIPGGGGGGVGTLQQVTDAGNTTTNNIESAGFDNASDAGVGYKLFAAGQIESQRAKTGQPNQVQPVFRGYQGADDTSVINSDGSASFSGTVDTTIPIATDGGFKVNYSDADYQTYIGIKTNEVEYAFANYDINEADLNFGVKLDGSAEFAGDVSIGTPATDGIVLYEAGQILAKSASDSTAIQVNRGTSNNFRVDSTGHTYIGTGINASASNASITLNADGSGTFTGAVTSPRFNGGTNSSDYAFAGITDNSTYATYYAENDASGGMVFEGNSLDGRTISLFADGSASFLSGSITLNANGNVSAPQFVSETRFLSTAAAGQVFNANSDAIIMNADGSAKFAGDIDIGDQQYQNPGNGGIYLAAMGTGAGTIHSYKDNVYSAGDGNDSNSFLRCWSAPDDATTKTEKIGFRTDGTGSFAGRIDSGVYGIPSSKGRVQTFCGGQTADPTTWQAFVGFYNDAPRSWIRADGQIRISDVNAADNPKIILEPDGSAEFDGNVQSQNAFQIFKGTTQLGAMTWQGDDTNHVGYLQLDMIGASAVPVFRVNDDGTESVAIYGDGNATFVGTINGATVGTSDEKFKENITPASSQLSDVVALGGMLKNFDWNDDAPVNESIRATRHLGLVAQQVEAVCPSLVKTLGSEDDTHKGISHDALIMKLLGAVKELDALRPTHVSFDGSGGDDFDFSTAKIASHNVASVERTAKGMFTITFTTPFASDKYTAVATAGDENHTGTGASPRCVNVVARTANSLDIVVERSDDAVQDDDGYISVFIAS